MAFGKDDTHLQNIPGFGGDFTQQGTQASVRQPRGGRGKTPYWIGNFEISENPAMPDTFRVLRGEYAQQVPDGDSLITVVRPFVEFTEHFHGGLSKGGICSGGPRRDIKGQREPCSGCDIFWEDYQARGGKKTGGPNRISKMNKFGFSLWDYAYYFQMPQLDAQGNYRINQKTNQPYTEWTKAANPQDPKFHGHPWKAGHLVPWSIGKLWKDTLVSYNVAVGASCLTCRNRNTMQSHGWYCGAGCGHFIFDPNNTTLSSEDQMKLSRQRFMCPTCKQTMFPKEEVSCTVCGPQGKRASIFDVDLTGFVQKSAANQGPSSLIIMGYGNVEPIRVQDPAVLETIKPLDLLARYAPTPIEVQAKLWNVLPPHQPQAAPQPGHGQWAPPPGAPPAQGYAPPPPPAAPQYAPPMAPQAAWAPPAQQSAAPTYDDLAAQLAALKSGFGQ